MRRRPSSGLGMAVGVLAGWLLLAGCAAVDDAGFDHPGVALPTYALLPADETVWAMRRRDAALTAWRARGTLTITEPNQTHRLSAIVLFDRTDEDAWRLRLRASKLGQTVADLVYADRAAWLWLRRSDEDAGWPDLDGPAFTLPRFALHPDPGSLLRQSDDLFVFAADSTTDRPPAELWVHRPTRTVHRVVVPTPDQPVTTSFRYLVGEPTPHVDAIEVALPQGRTIRLRVESLQPNPSLSPAQFEPIPGSRRLGDPLPGRTGS
ncbi:MAG: hypothetical protein AAGH92_11235 [Planctomycetota bacterium]